MNVEEEFIVVDQLTLELSRGLGEREIGLRGVSLEIGRGEICVFGGEAGSGKSALSRLLLGVKTPRSKILTGRILLQGEDLFAQGSRARRLHRIKRVGFVGRRAEEVFNLKKTVRQCLREHSRMKEARGLMVGESDWSDLFYRVGIIEPERILSLPVGALSRVLVQRLALMRALMSGAEVLVCDDATAELDRVAESQFLDLVAQLKDEMGLTVVMAMGNLRGVERFADRLAIFYEGGILESGSARDVVQNPRFDYTREFLASTPNLSDIPRELPTISREAVREAEEKIHDQPATLESSSTG